MSASPPCCSLLDWPSTICSVAVHWPHVLLPRFCTEVGAQRSPGWRFQRCSNFAASGLDWLAAQSQPRPTRPTPRGIDQADVFDRSAYRLTSLPAIARNACDRLRDAKPALGRLVPASPCNRNKEPSLSCLLPPAIPESSDNSSPNLQFTNASDRTRATDADRSNLGSSPWSLCIVDRVVCENSTGRRVA